jgi:hypothetical protein
MIESLKEHIGVQPNAQNIDTRLLLGSKDTLTAEAFLTIIREYNSMNGSPLNETYAYMINSIDCRYKTKRAYQNHQTDNGMILNKINPKPDKKTPVQKGTTTMAAQGDTGANCSATDTIDIIHNYVELETRQEVGEFSDDKTGSTLQALREGVIKIISDQGSIMN